MGNIENNSLSNLVVEYSLKENSAINVISNSVKGNLEKAELTQANVETDKRIAKNGDNLLSIFESASTSLSMA